ncbi:hypothetical protein ADJ73_12345 [Arsenicicoccus sp. oral taxon 190]|nr:hypothetical protein ADJ73_12345 [Arsenicicoccus sp. oral taxon 190]
MATVAPRAAAASDDASRATSARSSPCTKASLSPRMRSAPRAAVMAARASATSVFVMLEFYRTQGRKTRVCHPIHPHLTRSQ